MITRKRTVIVPDWAGSPVEHEMGGWPVVDHFEPQLVAAEVNLVDLSHRPKAIVQGDAPSGAAALAPGQVAATATGYIAQAKSGEALVIDLTGPIEPQWKETHYTDVTDGLAMFAIWGSTSIDILRRLVAIDIERPDLSGPFYLATGALGIRVQIINLKASETGFILLCQRSQGQNLFDACLRFSRQFELTITGDRDFRNWWLERDIA